jgi:phosphoglycolate phosphatase
MIGDTTFDLEMGNAAGVKTIGVTWGNHTREKLRECTPTWLIDSVSELQEVLEREISIP